jgi:hypothetical protein
MRGDTRAGAGLRWRALPRGRWSSWSEAARRKRRRAKRERLEVIERLVREERRARRAGEFRPQPERERRWC